MRIGECITSTRANKIDETRVICAGCFSSKGTKLRKRQRQENQ